MSEYILPNITQCGYFNCREEFGDLTRSPERVAGDIEIELFLEDGEKTFINGREYKILKDHVIVAKAGSTRYSLLPFKTVYVKLSTKGRLAELLNQLPDYFRAIRVEKLKETMNDIILLHEENPKNQLLLGARLLTLIDLLTRDAAHMSYESTKAYPLLHKAKKFIEEHFSQALTTADVASAVNLSESRFRFLFGKVYGISPRQYLTNVRIGAAKQLLWEDLSMVEIAERCGFGCQQYFSDVFKKQTGTTPRQYKNQLAMRYYD